MSRYSRRADQHGAVEELGAVALADAGDQMQPVFGGYFAPGAHRWSRRHWLGCRERLLARPEYVSAVAELGQHHKPGAEPNRAGDQLNAVGDIRFDVSDRRLHLNAGNLDLRFVGCRRGKRIHRTPLLCVAQNKKPPNASIDAVRGLHSQI